MYHVTVFCSYRGDNKARCVFWTTCFILQRNKTITGHIILNSVNHVSHWGKKYLRRKGKSLLQWCVAQLLKRFSYSILGKFYIVFQTLILSMIYLQKHITSCKFFAKMNKSTKYNADMIPSLKVIIIYPLYKTLFSKTRHFQSASIALWSKLDFFKVASYHFMFIISLTWRFICSYKPFSCYEVS